MISTIITDPVCPLRAGLLSPDGHSGRPLNCGTRRVKPRQSRSYSLPKRLEQRSANLRHQTSGSAAHRSTKCPAPFLRSNPSITTSSLTERSTVEEKNAPKSLTKMDQSPPHAVTTSRFSDTTGHWECERPHSPHGYDSQTIRSLPRNILIVSYNVSASPPPPARSITLPTSRSGNAPAPGFERMTFLLDYLRRVIDACRDMSAGSDVHGEPTGEGSFYPTPPPANVIMLQEVTREAFDAILRDQWVKEYYQIVPSSPDEWTPEPAPGPHGKEPERRRKAEYGNVILATRSLPVMRPRIIHFADTTEQRTAVTFDTFLSVPRHPWQTRTTHRHEKRTTARLRLACSQLESGQLGVFSRRHQLETVSSEIMDNRIDGAVLAGDMNVAHFGDVGMPQLVGLSDAETRAENDSTSFTWGYHPGRSGKQPCRRDKILYWQNRKRFRVNEIRTLGIGLKMRNGEYVTDHYGIMTSIEPLE